MSRRSAKGPPAQTRARLLEVGERLFAEKGYHGVGLKEILDRAGTPKGSFYNFFDSKEAFAGEVVMRHALALAEAFERRFAESGDPPLEILRKSHTAVLDAYEANRCVQTCIMARFALDTAAEDELSERLRRIVKSWLGRLAALIGEAQARGEVRTDQSAEDYARLFWQTWEGALVHMKLSGETAPARRSLDMLIDTVLAAPSSAEPS